MENRLIIPEVQDSEVQVRPINECLSPRVKRALADLSPEIRALSIKDLETRINITPKLRMLKISFWDQYQRTIDQNLKYISPTEVCANICSTVFWDVYVIRNEEILAWLFHPPTSFDKKAEEALDYGIERLREEILTAPLYSINKDGSRGAFNKDNAGIVLRAIQFLDARVKGSPLQRIEQKSLHLHKDVTPPKGVTREELDSELETIRQRLSGAPMQLTSKVPDETE